MIFIDGEIKITDQISAVAATAAALISAFAFLAAWYQIKKINRRNAYDAYNQVKKDIDSDFTRMFVKAIKDSQLEIVEDSSKQSGSDKICVSGTDFTSKILDHLEDLYIYYSKGLISIDIIESGFSQKILTIGNNREVEKYIDKLREKDDDNELYAGFHELYKVTYSKLKGYQKKQFRKDIL